VTAEPGETTETNVGGGGTPDASPPATSPATFEEFATSAWVRGSLLRTVHADAQARGLREPGLDAEGVVQDALLITFLYWTRIAEGHHRSYARTVARNLVASAQRREVRQRLRTAVVPEWTSAVRQPRVDDVLVRQLADEALRSLSDRQRTATYLRHGEGWSSKEIAEQLGCASSTADVHVHRGTEKVRAWIGDHLEIGVLYNRRRGWSAELGLHAPPVTAGAFYVAAFVVARKLGLSAGLTTVCVVAAAAAGYCTARAVVRLCARPRSYGRRR
jgi:RNA polymerase sigma factor (sigma-70 family)